MLTPPKKLLFGTAGIPISTKPRDTGNGIRQVKKLGLGSMELEFVRSVNIKLENAPKIKEIRDEEDVYLTCHAPYFINLNGEPKVYHASINRIVSAAKVADACGAYSVCFHPGFYMGMDKKQVFNTIKERTKKLMDEIKKQKIDIWVRPETTGKPTQFGDIDELLELCKHFDQMMPCIDFSHLHARTNGKYNTEKEFVEVLKKVDKTFGKKGLENMHIHISGIDYGEKGEKKHLIFEEADMNIKDLVKVWKKFKIKGCVTCESPNIEVDAKIIKELYEKA